MKPRAVAFSAAAFIAITTAALAQQDGSPFIFIPEFEAQPTQGDYIANYPRQALRENVSGIAVLCCDERGDRSLDCAVNLEWPEERGFGAASLVAARAYRLTPQSHADLAARPGVKVRLSVRWVGPVPSPETIEDLRRRDRESLEACLPPPDHSAPDLAPVP